MQIAFFDPSSDEITSQSKGKMFERFAARLVEICGYRDVNLRSKRASLEYDIEARSVLHGHRLYGEAKAHEALMPGKEAAAFVGKLLPFISGDATVHGLFISTSSFTAEARDYLSALVDSGSILSKISLRTLAGDEIPRLLAENGRCIPESSLRELAKRFVELEPFDTWLTISERGDFFIISFGKSIATTATRFAVFTLTGEWINVDNTEQRRLTLQVSDLEDLTFASPDKTQSGDSVSDRQALPEVLAGTGWFDYKFPSPPDCFIGREAALEQIDAFLNDVRGSATTLRSVQVLSRSGVGKSSLLLKIADSDRTNVAVTVDGRNLRVPSDLRLVVAELVALVNEKYGENFELPTSQEDIRATLELVGHFLRAKSELALLQIDQFEALLSRPAVFQSLLDLLVACTTLSLPLIWIMARKNDLAATYDEGARIDLAQMNDLTRPIYLDDFSPPEERALLNRLGSELGAAVSQQLSEAILTFSAGFPWLLKRICAHVITMDRRGISQASLVRGGLRAEDLFSEDLAGLEESDKAILKTLAAHLPNTASELARRLEGEISVERLTQKLNDFLGGKLFRLSGDVYDTYNDVFKAYLLTDRIPFQTRFVFRVTPGPAFALITRIADYGPTDIADFAQRIGGNATATYNKLRELRLLGLLDPQPGRVALSQEAIAALESDKLGDYLRRALRSNSLVSRVLDLVANSESVTLEDVSQLLRRELPHINANDNTWTSYASILVNWVRYAGMIDLEGDRVRPKDAVSDEFLLRRDFTLGSFSTGTFIPSVRPGSVRDLVVRLGAGAMQREALRQAFGDKITTGLIRDAKSLALVDEQDGMVGLTAQARALLESRHPITDQDISLLCLSKPNVEALLSAARVGAVSQAQHREILSRFGGANWADGTWKWRLGILVSWVVATGQAKSGRLGIRAVAS